MSFWLGVLAGLVLASIYIWNPWTTNGVLKIDHSNAEKDVYRFEISDLDKLGKMRKVILKIDNNADLSQK